MDKSLFVSRPYVSVTWEDPEKRIATIKIYEKGQLIKETNSAELGIAPRAESEGITAYRNRCKEDVFTKWAAQQGKGGDVLEVYTKADLEQKVRERIADLQKQIMVIEDFAKTMGLEV